MNIEKDVEDIKYEIDMFRFTADKLANRELLEATQNVFIESFTIHTRNLFYFFYTSTRSRKNKDDILAEDYAIKKREFKTQRTKKRFLNYIPKRVAKQIAHLTYHRRRYNKRTKPWKIQDIRNKMDKTIAAFINSLAEEQKTWFK